MIPPFLPKTATESLAPVKKFAKTRSSKNSKIEMRWQYIRSYFVYKQLSGSIHSLFKLSSINVIWSPNWRLVLVLKAINQERKSLLIGLLLALKIHLKNESLQVNFFHGTESNSVLKIKLGNKYLV